VLDVISAKMSQRELRSALQKFWSNTLNGWLTAITVAGFLLAIGRFLDKYHISLREKDAVRSLLVRAFVVLDSVPIPDLPRRTLAVLLRPQKAMDIQYAAVLLVANISVMIIMIVTYEAWVTKVGPLLMAPHFLAFRLMRHFQLYGIEYVFIVPIAILVCFLVCTFFARYIGGQPPDDNLSFAWHFSPLLIIAVTVIALILIPYIWIWWDVDQPWFDYDYLKGLIMLATSALMPIPVFAIMRYTFAQLYNNRFSIIRYLSPLFTALYAIMIVSTVVFLFMAVFAEDYLGDIVAVAFTGSALSPVAIIATVIVCIFGAKLFIELTRKGALLVFEAASAPEVSPFSYAAALLGILVLASKLIMGSSNE
jgi:hypothetical protein